MKKKYQSTPIFTLLVSVLLVTLNNTQVSAAKLRVVAYNVACGQWATPEQIAEFLKPLNADIVLLSEVPKVSRGKKVKDWSQRLGDALGLGHVRVGMVSSANHKAPTWGDVTGNYGGKFKSVLSRAPLMEGKDLLLEGSGWARASAFRVETEINGRKLALYSLHSPGFAHHKRQPTELSAWEGSKQKALADHINAEKERSSKLLATGRDWGPKNQNKDNVKSNGCLSDHPWVWCELEISDDD